MKLKLNLGSKKELPPAYTEQASSSKPSEAFDTEGSSSKDKSLLSKIFGSGRRPSDVPAAQSTSAALLPPDYSTPSQEGTSALFKESSYTKKDKIELARAISPLEESIIGIAIAETWGVKLKEDLPSICENIDMNELASVIVMHLRESGYFENIILMKAKVYSAEVLLHTKQLEGSSLNKLIEKMSVFIVLGATTQEDFKTNSENLEILKKAYSERTFSQEIIKGGIFEKGMGYASSQFSRKEAEELRDYFKSPLGRKVIHFENSLDKDRAKLNASNKTREAVTKATQSFLQNESNKTREAVTKATQSFLQNALLYR